MGCEAPGCTFSNGLCSLHILLQQTLERLASQQPRSSEGLDVGQREAQGLSKAHIVPSRPSPEPSKEGSSEGTEHAKHNDKE